MKKKYFNRFYFKKNLYTFIKHCTLIGLFSILNINAINSAANIKNMNNKNTKNIIENNLDTRQNLTNIEITTLNNAKVDIKTKIDFSKSKYHMIVFMAKWCPYCIMELKDLELKFEEFQDAQINIIPIFIDLDTTQVLELYNELNIVNLKDKVFIDKDAEMFHKLNLKGFPNTFFTNSKGTVIVDFPRKYIDWKQIKKMNNIKSTLYKCDY
ncbi:MAG: redoxin domain-containing protein [Rickettsiales bacterium]